MTNKLGNAYNNTHTQQLKAMEGHSELLLLLRKKIECPLCGVYFDSSQIINENKCVLCGTVIK